MKHEKQLEAKINTLLKCVYNANHHNDADKKEHGG